ncbi:riboflavin kinase [Patescibacteria group bacterium]
MEINSIVTKGIGLGEQIGFPTLNLNPKDAPDEFGTGVYNCEVEFEDVIYKGVMHYGPKSIGTDNPNKTFFEIHVLNFNKSINNEKVKVKVLKKIRDVREFKSAYELIDQINKDISNA